MRQIAKYYAMTGHVPLPLIAENDEYLVTEDDDQLTTEN